MHLYPTFSSFMVSYIVWNDVVNKYKYSNIYLQIRISCLVLYDSEFMKTATVVKWSSLDNICMNNLNYAKI